MTLDNTTDLVDLNLICITDHSCVGNDKTPLMYDQDKIKQMRDGWNSTRMCLTTITIDTGNASPVCSRPYLLAHAQMSSVNKRSATCFGLESFDKQKLLGLHQC